MKKFRPSKPELLYTLKNYNKKKFTADLMAGIIVGIVALPLAIAFGIASGVSPEKGILTAIIAGFAISVFGGSRVQIGGPTGAFIIIIYVIGRLVPHLAGCAEVGNYHPLHPLPHHCGIHQRYCPHHLLHSSERPSWSAHRGCCAC